MAPGLDARNLKMAVQSEISSGATEMFDNEMIDNFRLEYGPDDSGEKKSEVDPVDFTAEAEEEILNKFDTAEAASNPVPDEDALLEDADESTTHKTDVNLSESVDNGKASKDIIETMDAEDLLQVTSIKEAVDDSADTEKEDADTEKEDGDTEKEDGDTEKEDTSNENSCSSMLEKEDEEETTTDIIMDEGADKAADEAMDIEENHLSSEVGEEENPSCEVGEEENRPSSEVGEEENRSKEVVEEGFPSSKVDEKESGPDHVSEDKTAPGDANEEEKSPVEDENKGLGSVLQNEEEKTVEEELTDDIKIEETNLEEIKPSEGVFLKSEDTKLDINKKTDSEKCTESDRLFKEDSSECNKSIKQVCDEKPADTDGGTTATSNLQNDVSVAKTTKRSLSECETQVGSKKIRLTESQTPPAEQKIVILQTLADFMKSKSLKRLTRRGLEEFCIQKICEVLVHKSEIGELRHQLQTQEQMMEFWKKETTSMAKQVKDLEIVNKKMLNELKLRSDTDAFLMPVRITRSVGLQVKLEPVPPKRVSRGDPMSSSPQVVQARPRLQATPKSNAQATPKAGTQATPRATAQATPRATAPKNNAQTTPRATPQAQVKVVTKVPAKSPPKQATTATPRQNKTAQKPQSTPLLTQALQTENKRAAGQTTPPVEPKGVIDLTDEDDRPAPTPSAAKATVPTPRTQQTVTPAAIRTAVPSIALMTSQVKTATTTTTPPRLMYVVQQPQLQAGEIGKQRQANAVMFKLPIGQTNGILPAFQNGTSSASAAATVPIPPLQQAPQQRTAPVRLTTAVSTVPAARAKPTVAALRHPAPLPPPPTPPTIVGPKKPVPPKPYLSIRKSPQGIVLSWKMPYDLSSFEQIASYQLYAYQETSAPPTSEMWRKVGDVTALALPMACTLSQFADGNTYYFAVRAVDVLKRIGPFSDPEPINL